MTKASVMLFAYIGASGARDRRARRSTSRCANLWDQHLVKSRGERLCWIVGVCVSIFHTFWVCDQLRHIFTRGCRSQLCRPHLPNLHGWLPGKKFPWQTTWHQMSMAGRWCQITMTGHCAPNITVGQSAPICSLPNRQGPTFTWLVTEPQLCKIGHQKHPVADQLVPNAHDLAPGTKSPWLATGHQNCGSPLGTKTSWPTTRCQNSMAGHLVLTKPPRLVNTNDHCRNPQT